jgi:hypothetical protein
LLIFLCFSILEFPDAIDTPFCTYISLRLERSRFFSITLHSDGEPDLLLLIDCATHEDLSIGPGDGNTSYLIHISSHPSPILPLGWFGVRRGGLSWSCPNGESSSPSVSRPRRVRMILPWGHWRRTAILTVVFVYVSLWLFSSLQHTNPATTSNLTDLERQYPLVWTHVHSFKGSGGGE